jgi:hypothetical protein
MKAWQVGPYRDDWVAIVHADSRGRARMKGSHVDMMFGEFIDIRAIRLPDLDGKLITTQVLLDAGFPETVEGEPLEAWGYIVDCGCPLCVESLRQMRQTK